MLEGLDGGVQFADGTIPHLPIATAEIQGYVYDAKLRVAELARRLRRDGELAERLEREAEELYTRFNEDFWSDARGGYYAVGLDGDKRPHRLADLEHRDLLWSGIVPEERARLVAGQLMSDAMFSGWGVHPVADDRGQPDRLPHRHDLPHDNSIVALGLARAAFATRRTGSRSRSWRRPSPATGFRRRSQASSARSAASPSRIHRSPQAWATAAPFVFVQAMLGLEAVTAGFGSIRTCPRRSGGSAFAD